MQLRLFVPILVFFLLAGIVIPFPAAAIETYYISASAGEGGKIEPAGLVPVPRGEDQAFVITAGPGYRIDTVWVDQKSMGPVSFYTFSRVRSNHTISATFFPTTGAISVDSRPPGASVFLDSVFLGTTLPSGPVTFSQIAPGRHTLHLVLTGYQDYQSEVEVKEGQTTVVPPIVLIAIPTTSPTTSPPTTKPTTLPPTTSPTTSPPTTKPTTLPPTTSPTTSPPTTQPTTLPPTTSPTTSPPTTQPTTPPPTTSPTTSPPTTQPTTPPPTTSPTTSPPTTKPTTPPPTTSPTTSPPTTKPTTPPPTTSPTTSPPTTQPTTPPPTFYPLTTIPTTPPPTPDTIPSGTPVPGTQLPSPPGGGGALPPWQNTPWALLLAGTGVLATAIFSRDVLSSRRVTPLPRVMRLAVTVVSALPCAALALILRAQQDMFPAGTGITSPELAVFVVPAAFFLILSSLGLVIGAALSWPLRGLLKAHTIGGVLVMFLSLLSLARGDSTTPFFPGVMLLAGILAILGARWQEGLFGAPAGVQGHEREAEVPSSDVTRAVPARGESPFPPELAKTYSGIRFIGSGGLAHVYRAENVNTGETVAVKIPLRADEATGKSFMKEILGWEGLSHPNIVRVNQVNILPVPYIEMEYIEKTLADTKKPLPVRKAARICRDIARGLAYAHDHNIIHRDIKPQNILVTKDETPKISDWGMSKVVGVSRMPTIAGFSLAYAAPEQVSPASFGETDQRTDIYQLGCVLYELLTGRVPFPGTDMGEVTAAILSREPLPPSVYNPGARPLDAIVMKCLAKRPEERYQDAGELANDLEKFLQETAGTDDYDIFED
ncbi:MAG: protein kinase [Methanolinea sp.]|nr:protein kinase [Methanolinea sp.]